MDKKELSRLKKFYQTKFQEYCKKFLQNHNSQAYLRKQTLLVDALLINVWQSLSISKDIVLEQLVVMEGKSYFHFLTLTY